MTGGVKGLGLLGGTSSGARRSAGTPSGSTPSGSTTPRITDLSPAAQSLLGKTTAVKRMSFLTSSSTTASRSEHQKKKEREADLLMRVNKARWETPGPSETPEPPDAS